MAFTEPSIHEVTAVGAKSQFVDRVSEGFSCGAFASVTLEFEQRGDAPRLQIFFPASHAAYARAIADAINAVPVPASAVHEGAAS